MLTADEARQLDRLAIGAATSVPATGASGARISRARGSGLEFREFRRYEPGDDPRAIDWMVHARLRQLVVRVHRADAHLKVHILLDTSGSMSAGAPDKLTTAKKAAAMIAYIAAGRRDAVGLACFDDTIRLRMAPASGRQQTHRVFEALAPLAAAGRSDLNQALSRYAGVAEGPGLAVVISDFFHANEAFEGLRVLLHRGLPPAVVQVVAPEELDPEDDAEVELVDIEDPHAPPVIVDALVAAEYRSRMATLSARLGEFCITRGLSYVRLTASSSFGQLLRACLDASLLAGPG